MVEDKLVSLIHGSGIFLIGLPNFFAGTKFGNAFTRWWIDSFDRSLKPSQTCIAFRNIFSKRTHSPRLGFCCIPLLLLRQLADAEQPEKHRRINHFGDFRARFEWKFARAICTWGECNMSKTRLATREGCHKNPLERRLNAERNRVHLLTQLVLHYRMVTKLIFIQNKSIK